MPKLQSNVSDVPEFEMILNSDLQFKFEDKVELK